jgi:hypothetical protein
MLERRQVGNTMMPALRAFAAQASAELPSMRPEGVTPIANTTTIATVTTSRDLGRIGTTTASLGSSQAALGGRAAQLTATPVATRTSSTMTTIDVTPTSSADGAVSVSETLVDRPSDADFKWAQDSYNVTQRNIDTWSFFVTFRSWLWNLDQKWTYIGRCEGRSRRS